jgi:hypothetical protein
MATDKTHVQGEDWPMSDKDPESEDKLFPWSYSSWTLLGFALAVVPPVVLDPMLHSHVGFEPRSYAYWWLFIPIGVSLFFVSTYLLSSPRLKSFSPAWVFIAALFGSLFVLKPEFPHMNVVFVGIVWLLISTLWHWLRASRGDVARARRIKDREVKLAYVNEEASFLRSLFLGAVGAYLSLLVGGVVALHAWNHDMLTDPREQLMMNQYSNIQFMLFSAYYFFGPLREIVDRRHRLVEMLLD